MAQVAPVIVWRRGYTAAISAALSGLTSESRCAQPKHFSVSSLRLRILIASPALE
jgi:hypothetical protein